MDGDRAALAEALDSLNMQLASVGGSIGLLWEVDILIYHQRKLIHASDGKKMENCRRRLEVIEQRINSEGEFGRDEGVYIL